MPPPNKNGTENMKLSDYILRKCPFKAIPRPKPTDLVMLVMPFAALRYGLLTTKFTYV